MEKRDLNRIEARFTEKRGRSFYFVWKNKPYPECFICCATPYSVSKHFKISKKEAFQLIKTKLNEFKAQIEEKFQREKKNKDEIESLIDRRLTDYKRICHIKTPKYRFCRSCGKPFEISSSFRFYCYDCHPKGFWKNREAQNND